MITDHAQPASPLSNNGTDRPTPLVRLLGTAPAPKLLLVSLLALFGIIPEILSIKALHALGTCPMFVHVAAAPDPIYLSHADSWVIATGAQTLAQGGDPLISNPQDPWGRPLNYPRAVGVIAEAVGIQWGDARILGGSFAILFCVGLGFMLRLLNTPAALVAFFLVASPPTLLGLERGNLDIAIFGVIASVAFAAPRLLPAALSGMCILKLFPVFGLAAVLQTRPGKHWIPWLLGGTVCLGYIALIWHDLSLIRSATPTSDFLSWGSATIWLKLKLNVIGWFPKALSILFVLAGVGLALRLNALCLNSFLPPQDCRLSVAAALGSALYAGCFLLGTNYDYRLIFTLLMLPLLLSLAQGSRVKPKRWAARVGIAVLGCVLWSPTISTFYEPALWIVDEASTWLLLIVAGWLLVPRNRQETAQSS